MQEPSQLYPPVRQAFKIEGSGLFGFRKRLITEASSGDLIATAQATRSQSGTAFPFHIAVEILNCKYSVIWTANVGVHGQWNIQLKRNNRIICEYLPKSFNVPTIRFGNSDMQISRNFFIKHRVLSKDNKPVAETSKHFAFMPSGVMTVFSLDGTVPLDVLLFFGILSRDMRS